MKSDERRLWGTEPQTLDKSGADERQRQPDPETPPLLVVPDNRVYTPYENRSRPESLILFCAALPSQFPAYMHLLNISFDHRFGQTFTLLYPFMTVNVSGKGLGEIVHAVNFRRCAIIREWHRDLYDPPQRGVAVVERIEVVMPGEPEL